MIVSRRSFGTILLRALLVPALLGLAAFDPPPAAAQDAAAPALLDARIADFFRSLGDLNGTRRAFDVLLEGGPTEDSDRIDQMVEKVQQMETRFGPIRSTERLVTRTVGSDVYLSTYLAKTDQLPITWNFIFYRRPGQPSDESAWTVISVRFDSDTRTLEHLGLETPTTE